MIANISFSALLTVLGVQWIRIAQGAWGGSLAWFHIAALAFSMCALFDRKVRHALLDVQTTAWPITAGFALYVVMLACAVGLLDEHYASEQVIVRQLFSLAIFIPAAGFIVSRLRDDAGSVLLCATVASAAGFTIAMMAHALSIGGQSPSRVLIQALQSGNTDDLIFGLFKHAFGASLQNSSLQDVEVRANLRHGIVSALLCTALISQLFLAKTTRAPIVVKSIAVTGIISVLLFTLVSLSRSMILSVAIYVVVLVGLFLAQRKYLCAVGCIGIIMFGVVFAVGYSRVGATLENRFFSETSAYEGRLLGIRFAIEEINRHPVFPGVTGAHLESPHNFLLDAWLGGGFIAAAAALMVVLSIMVLWVKLAVWSMSSNGASSWAICAPVLGAGIIPMIRFFTAGGGTLHLGEWLSLAVFVAGWHYIHGLRLRSSAVSARIGTLTQKFPQLLS